MAKQNKADIWVSSEKPLEFDKNFYYLVQAFEGKEVGLDKISWDYERESKKIPEHRLKDWRKRCGNPNCARGIEKLTFNGEEFKDLEGNSEAIDNKVDEILGRSGDNLLIEGGHHIPDLKDLSFTSIQPYKALEEALKIAEKAYNKGKKADILVFVNDLHMGKEYSPENREDCFKNYELPTKMKELILKYREKFDFNVLVAGERKLYDRLNREKKRLIREGKIEKGEGKDEGNYYINLGGERKLLISHQKNNPTNGQLKCIGACTKVIEMVHDMGYSGFVQVYPVCAPDSVELSVKFSKELYGDNIPVMNVYRTRTCFADKEFKTYKP